MGGPFTFYGTFMVLFYEKKSAKSHHIHTLTLHAQTEADCCKKEYELLKNGTLEMCFNWAKIAPKEHLRTNGVKPSGDPPE